MKIFTQVKDSIINKEFYQSIPENIHLSQAVKYLIRVSLLLSIIGVAIAGFHMPKFINSAKEAASSFVASYPEDLTVNLKGGSASINKPEPFAVPFSEKLKASIEENNKNISEDTKTEKEWYKDLLNIVVIDTTKPFSIEEFKNMKTIAWVTKTEIITQRGSNGEIQIIPMKDFKDVEINKSWVDQREELFYKLLPTFVVFAIIAIYIMFFIGTFFSSIFFALFYGLVIYGMSQISKSKKELTYKQSYIMSIYAMTPVLALNAFSLYIKIPLQGILNLLILVAIVYINYFKKSVNSTQNTSGNAMETPQMPVNTGGTEAGQ